MAARGWIGLVLGLLAVVSFAEPAVFTNAERHAVGFAYSYCTGGADAVADRLGGRWMGDVSAARRALELEVRVGSSCHRWTLGTVDRRDSPELAVFLIQHPSGIEDAVFLGFDAEGQVDELWGSAERRTIQEEGHRTSSGAVSGAGSGAVSRQTLEGVVLAAALFLLMVGVLAGRSMGWQRRPARGVLLVCLVSLLWWACAGERTPEGDSATERPVVVEEVSQVGQLAPLLQMRRTLIERRSDSDASEGAPEVAGEGGSRTEYQRYVRALWLAQASLQQGEVDRAQQWLNRVPKHEARVRALAGWVAAELAVEGFDRTAAALSVGRAVSASPSFDGAQLDAAHLLFEVGAEDKALGYIGEAAKLGSRLAEVYYLGAKGSILEGAWRDGLAHLNLGFQLQPKSRAAVLSDALLSLYADPAMDFYGHLRLAQVEEPTVLGSLSSWNRLAENRPLPILEAAPPEAIEVAGLSLRIRVGDGFLLVPGGSDLAPAGTRQVPAGAWRQEMERAALDDLEGLSRPRGQAALTQVDIERVELAAVALAKRFRWLELIHVTEALRSDVPSLSSVLSLRAVALERVGRRAESRSLLIGLTKNVLEQGRREPGTLYQLASVLALQEEFALAEKLVVRANEMFPSAVGYPLIQQYRMEEALARSARTVVTENFLIRHPPNGEYVAGRVGKVLEAERKRMGKWIPLAFGPRIEVHLLSIESFRDRYAGRVDVVGIYDGRIRVPLADMSGLHPSMVSILTHELGHALIARATGDLAPKWMHEGLAQLLEMVEQRTNPMPDYMRSGRFLSFPMVEEVLQGFPNTKLVATAYDEALWTLLYLDRVRGKNSIQRLLKAFRGGQTTPEALRSVLDTDAAGFDLALREWWSRGAPKVVRSPVVRYDRWLDLGSTQRPRALSAAWWRNG